jgi:hypothetical protein
MVYGRSFNSRELLIDRQIFIDYVLPFILDCGWRLKDYGLKKDNPRSRGNVSGKSYIPESSIVCWALLD